MKIIIYISALFFVLFGGISLAYAGSEEFTCYRETKLEIPFDLCYRKAEFVNSSDTIYFFHDANSDEQDWFKSAKGLNHVQARLDQQNYRPRIVSLSFGRRKIVLKNIGTPEYNFFLKTAIPFVEENVLSGASDGQRIIIGQSVGALSALSVSLRPERLFSKIILLCPTFTDLNPYSSQAEFQDYVSKYNLNPEALIEFQKLQKENYLSAMDWKQNHGTYLVSRFGAQNKPQIYISAGSSQGAGYELGVRTFLVAAKRAGFQPQFEPTNGNHCSYRIQGVADFILER